MNKNIKIKFIGKTTEELKFEILEDAKKGDIIDLKEINNIDFSFLQSSLENEKNSILIKKHEEEISNIILQKEKDLETLRTQQKNEIDKAKLEIKSEFSEENNSLKNIVQINKNEVSVLVNQHQKEKELWETKKESEIRDGEIKIRNIALKEQENLKLSLDSKEKEIITLKIQNEDIVNQTRLQTELDFRDKISERDKKINDINNELKNSQNNEKNEIEKTKLKMEVEFEKKIGTLTNEHNNKINSKENEIKEQKNIFDSQISVMKKDQLQNSKSLGEELEKWIENELTKNLSFMGEDIKFYKSNKIIGGKKPDFEVDLFKHERLISKFVIEAKTEKLGSKNKNKDYLQKLFEDTKNRNGNVAILVTELEKHMQFTVYKEKYKDIDIYVTRPEFLIPLLQFMIYLSQTHSKIEEANFEIKRKENVLREFEELKSDIIANQFEKIDKNYETIIKLSDNMQRDLGKLKTQIDIIVNTHMAAAKRKIEGWKIHKIINEPTNFIEEKPKAIKNKYIEEEI